MKKITVVMGMISAMLVIMVFPSYGQVINGCYQKNNGQLRILAAPGDACRPSEVAIQWNQKGDKGDKGEVGAAGTSFDLSKLYTVTSNYAPAFCNNDDVSISCTAICSTHPVFTSPPLPYPLYGVPEEVINGEFGINFAAEAPYAYEDRQPGACVAKCVVPPGDPGLPTTPPYPETYTPIIRVLCMPRD